MGMLLPQDPNPPGPPTWDLVTNMGSATLRNKASPCFPHRLVLRVHVSLFVTHPRAPTADADHSCIWEALATLTHMTSLFMPWLGHPMPSSSFTSHIEVKCTGSQVRCPDQIWLPLTKPVTLGEVLIFSLPVFSFIEKNHLGAHFLRWL